MTARLFVYPLEVDSPNEYELACFHIAASSQTIQVHPARESGRIEVHFMKSSLHLPIHQRRHLLPERVEDRECHVRAARSP